MEEIEEKTKKISINLEIEMIEKIEQLGKENHRNRSDQIRYMLDKYIEILEQK